MDAIEHLAYSMSPDMCLYILCSLAKNVQVTPAGYACMTHMLSTLAGGKMLVILEGG